MWVGSAQRSRRKQKPSLLSLASFLSTNLLYKSTEAYNAFQTRGEYEGEVDDEGGVFKILNDFAIAFPEQIFFIQFCSYIVTVHEPSLLLSPANNGCGLSRDK